MKSAMFELYEVLNNIIAPSSAVYGSSNKVISEFVYDWLIKGKDIQGALDVLKKHKKEFDEENRTKEFERIDITPEVCGSDGHFKFRGVSKAGMLEYKNKSYYWCGGCPMCVEKKIKEIKSK